MPTNSFPLPTSMHCTALPPNPELTRPDQTRPDERESTTPTNMQQRKRSQTTKGTTTRVDGKNRQHHGSVEQPSSLPLLSTSPSLKHNISHRRRSTANSKSGGNQHFNMLLWRVLPVLGAVGMLVMYYTMSSRILRQSIQMKITNPVLSLSSAALPRVPVVVKPRCVGYYFNGQATSSLVGAERLDPNLLRLYDIKHMRRPSDGGPILQMTEDDWKRQLALKDSKDYDHGSIDTFQDEGRDCGAQYDWQTTSFPTCNHLMELDMTYLVARPDVVDDNSHDTNNNATVANKHPWSTTWEPLRFIAHGYWRDVWKAEAIHNVATPAEKIVLKTLRYQHDYKPRNYDRHRRDAVAMERLSSSEFIMDIYASCGNGGLFEFADGGSLEDSIWYSDEEETKPWSSQERLVVAYQAAAGIAAVHNVAKEGVAAIAHTDITPGQFVYVDRAGVFRLNDFNRCRFIGWNNRTNTACPYHVGSNPGTFRSPEEYAYEAQTEKVDVYSLGNVLFAILTKQWPFEEVEDDKKARRRIKNGERPAIPDPIRNSTDPFDKAMLHAIEMCWIQNPVERASAREVQDYMTKELKRLGVKEN